MPIAAPRYGRIAIVLVLGVAICADAQQLPSLQSFEKARQSILRVDARGCGADSRVGTGFLWSDSRYVVTALHVISGCNNISVYSETTRTSRVAKIRNVLKRADLALVQISEPSPAAPLQLAENAPKLADELITIGYKLNIPRMDSTTLRLRFGGTRLREIVPDSVSRELERVGSPDINLEIVNLEGHLLPGLSGAPIIDATGKVVAIADGGLANGAASSSWGLPVANLGELLVSRDDVGTPVRTNALFAVDLDSSSGKNVTCGEHALTKVRTRGFLDLARSSDDQVGLQQLSAVLGFQQTDFQYDIYLDLNSGATVPIPAGADMTTAGGMCIVRLGSGRMEMRIKIFALASPAQAQQVALQYENELRPPGAGFAWQPDAQFTYLAPKTRFDGLIVNRKAAGKFVATQFGYMPQEYMFETLATRGQVLIGASVTNHDSSSQTMQMEIQCASGFAYPNCPQLIADRREWARMVLAVHMTTFPIG